jgi:membrane protein
VIRVSVQVVRQWARDRSPQQAASLAYQTVLSIVPLMAVALAVMRGTGNFGAESTFVDFVSKNVIPVSSEAISKQLVEWSHNITFGTVGVAGLIAVVVLAFVLFNSLERIINYIWRAERRRSLAQKFVAFYFTMTIGPFLIGVSLLKAAQVGLTTGWSGLLLSMAASFVALFLANYFLPATKVHVVPALIGATVTWFLFEAAKFGFKIYVAEVAFDRFAGIYGAVALVMLWLLWIYYCWLMVLLGTEVAHAMQNVRFLESIERRGRIPLEHEMLRRINGVVAARIMVAISEAYVHGRKGLTGQDIADRFDLSDNVVERICERLRASGVLLEVEGEFRGFIPAVPPHQISLSQILAAFRGDDIDPASPIRDPSRLEQVLRTIEADTRSRTDRLSLFDLIEEAPLANKVPSALTDEIDSVADEQAPDDASHDDHSVT